MKYIVSFFVITTGLITATSYVSAQYAVNCENRGGCVASSPDGCTQCKD